MSGNWDWRESDEKKYYFSLIDFDIASNFSKYMSKERHEELTSKLKEFLAKQRAKHPLPRSEGKCLICLADIMGADELRALSHRLCAKRDRPAQPVSFI